MHRVFRKKKTEGEENTCPLCSLSNPLDAESCSRCYYDFTVGVHQQSRKSDDAVVGGLLDELTSEIDEDEEDEADVDWTNHSFDMSDFSVDVADYDETDDVVISHSIGFARQLVSDDDIGADDDDDEDFVLSSDDAPTSVEKFVIPKGEEDDLSIPEPTKVKLIDPVSSSAQEMDSDLLNDDWSASDSAPIIPSNDQDIAQPIIAPAPQSNESIGVEPVLNSESSLPPMPNMPQQPVEQPSQVVQPTPVTPVTPVTPPPSTAFENTPSPQSTPSMPTMPLMPNATPTPIPTPEIVSEDESNIWPWVQTDPWDDRILAAKIKEAMEAAKSNRKEEAAEILDEIGPHISDRYRLMLYVGALLKNLGRNDALQSMLEVARRTKSEDEHVQAALNQLG